MKKISIFALTLVLTALLFTGCRTTDGMTTPTTDTLVPTTTAPATVPTTEATVPTTEVPTEVTTTPTDGVIDPTDNTDRNHSDGNPTTGDSGLTRGIRGIR